MVRCSARLSVALAAAFVAVNLFADVSWYWSNTLAGEEGPYDLADETLWKNGWFPAYGGGTVSTITNAVIGPVQNVTRTFTLSKDISVRGFTLGEAHQYKATTIFDLGKDRTLNIFGGTDAGFWFCGNYSKYQTFILKSGTLKSLPNAKKKHFSLQRLRTQSGDHRRSRREDRHGADHLRRGGLVLRCHERRVCGW